MTRFLKRYVSLVLTNFFGNRFDKPDSIFIPIFKTLVLKWQEKWPKCSSNYIFITQAFTLPSRIYGLFHLLSVVLWGISSVIDVKYYQYFSEVLLYHLFERFEDLQQNNVNGAILARFVLKHWQWWFIYRSISEL